MEEEITKEDLEKIAAALGIKPEQIKKIQFEIFSEVIENKSAVELRESHTRKLSYCWCGNGKFHPRCC